VTAVLFRTQTAWACPNCDQEHVTEITGPHQPYHVCPGLHYVLAPYVTAGTRCKVESVIREDYVGQEEGLRFDENRRPVSSVVTTRDEGQDCAVFAPTATARQEDYR
jgi:hypothetical protein